MPGSRRGALCFAALTVFCLTTISSPTWGQPVDFDPDKEARKIFTTVMSPYCPGLLLADCGHPAAALKSARLTRTLDPKGFWRVDRDLEPGQRRTTRTLFTFRRLMNLLEAGGSPGRAVWTLLGGPE